uniref:Uncharacterized protein n=1 Tax=Oryza rufipogon TaxID=4529 RepID=A0A0E0RIK1_ORYRU
MATNSTTRSRSGSNQPHETVEGERKGKGKSKKKLIIREEDVDPFHIILFPRKFDTPSKLGYREGRQRDPRVDL